MSARRQEQHLTISLNPSSAIGLVQMISRPAYVTGPTQGYMMDKENTRSK